MQSRVSGWDEAEDDETHENAICCLDEGCSKVSRIDGREPVAITKQDEDENDSQENEKKKKSNS